MLEFPLWKRVYLWAVTRFFALAAVPSLVVLTGASWPSVLPRPMVNLGLDLAGGSHILLEAESGQVARQRLETMEEAVRNALRDAEPRIRIGEISTRWSPPIRSISWSRTRARSTRRATCSRRSPPARA